MSNVIDPIVEDALVAYIKSQAPALIPVANVFSGLSAGANSEDPLDQDQQKHSDPLPNVIVQCDASESEASRKGNWIARPVIRIQTSAFDNTKAEHVAKAAEITGYFFTGIRLANDISAAAQAADIDFTTFLVIPMPSTTSREGRRWISSFELEMRVCGSVVA